MCSDSPDSNINFAAQNPMESNFERSKCVLNIKNGELYKSKNVSFPQDSIENLDLFKSQLTEDSFVCLERRSKGCWKIIQIIQPGSILHEVYAIAYRMNLDFSFDESVESEVEQLLNSPLDQTDCMDMRALPFVTVDGVGTRDLDQALYVVRAEEQNIVKPQVDVTHIVFYAIADASFFVRPGSALFKSALKRGTSMYFAGMSVPMLPHALSRGLISLNAHVDRRALVFVMQIDKQGKCPHTDLIRAVIHSHAKLTTPEVARFLDDPTHHRIMSTPYADSLLRLREVGEIRRAESTSRNVVQFNRVSLYTSLNASKTAFTLGMDERSAVDLYNEQLSLLCNMEGAKLLNDLAQKDPGILAIFRNHEAPSESAIDSIEIQINAIAKTQNLSQEWFWNKNEKSLSAYLNGLPNDEDGSDRFFRIRQAIERAVLMMQRRSVFSPEAGLHSALGVNPYARFSAPMREIVGVFMHKVAVDALFDKESDHKITENAILRDQVIAAANHARDIQRELDKAVDSCAIAHAIADDYNIPFEKRPIRQGTILGMKSSALYVRLDMPPIELKVYLCDMQQLTGEAWYINDDFTVCNNKSETRRYSIGDTVGIRVSSYMEQKKKWRVVLM